MLIKIFLKLDHFSWTKSIVTSLHWEALWVLWIIQKVLMRLFNINQKCAFTSQALVGFGTLSFRWWKKLLNLRWIVVKLACYKPQTQKDCSLIFKIITLKESICILFPTDIVNISKELPIKVWFYREFVSFHSLIKDYG